MMLDCRENQGETMPNLKPHVTGRAGYLLHDSVAEGSR